MKLISMTDFVLEQNEKIKKEKYGIESYYSTIQVSINYANFLKQPLKLEMFVPLDDGGNILEEPIFFEPNNENEIGNYQILIDEYYEARAKVLFEGFDLNQKDFSKLENIFCLTKECFQITFFTKEKGCFMDNLKTNKTYEIKTIEDLIEYDLQLTENAIKQIGL